MWADGDRGVTHADVDLDGTGQFGPHLRVRQTLVEVDYVVTVSEPKTAKSRRVVALDPTVVAVLRRHRTRQHKDRLACGPAYADHDLVLARADGSPVQPSNFVQCSPAASAMPECRTSGSTICGTPTRRCRSKRASIRRSSASGSAISTARHLQPRRPILAGRGCCGVRRPRVRDLMIARSQVRVLPAPPPPSLLSR